MDAEVIFNKNQKLFRVKITVKHFLYQQQSSEQKSWKNLSFPQILEFSSIPVL